MARMEDTRLPKCVMFGEIMVGGAGCMGGQGKIRVGGGVSPGRPQSFRHQRLLVDDIIRGGTFHGEIDRCRGIAKLDYGMQWYART